MNVGVFVSGLGVQQGYENNVSGHLQIALMSCDVLSKSGLNVHIVGTKQEGHVFPNCMPSGIPVHTVTDGKHRGKFGWDSVQSGYSCSNVIRQVRDIRRVAKDLKLDILHMFGFEGTMKLGSVVALTGVPMPVVATLYGPCVSRRWKRVYSNLRGIATATAHVKKESERLGVRVRQIRHGIVRQFQCKRAANPSRVLFWREGTKSTGADLCVRSFIELAKEYPQFSFDMALRTNKFEIPEIEEMERSTHSNINVFRFPYPDGKTLDQLLGEAVCVVLPFRALSIHPQLAIAESLALGVPVICADVGSCSEFVESGKNGYVVGSGDACGVTDAIRRVLNAPHQARQMSDNARQHLLSRWNWDQYGAEVARFYDDAIRS